MLDKNVNNKANNNLLIGVIVVMAIVISIMGFYLGKMSGTNNNSPENPTTIVDDTPSNYEDLSIKIITDERNKNSQIEMIINKLNELPSVKNIEKERLTFQDESTQKYLKEAGISYLPAIIFSTNKFDVTADPQEALENGQMAPKIDSYLQGLSNGEFTLPIGANFDPFIERSENGFRILPEGALDTVKQGAYLKGSENPKITWLEFSDLECPYCAQFANSGTDSELFEKYGEDLNKVFNHFPLDFHKNAQPAAEILECVGAEKGKEAFYALMSTSFTAKKSDKEFLIEEAVKLGVAKATVEKCLEDGTYAQKVKDQMAFANKTFGITGTPASVLVNTETGEFDVISGAYPTPAFVAAIDSLLGVTEEK